MNKVYIIAEAGVNHNGSLLTAKKMIDVAVEAGVDAIKFQTFRAETLVSKQANKAEYQKKTSDPKETQFDMIKKLELDVGAHEELISYCGIRNITFLSTAFDNDSIDLLSDLGLGTFKISSGDIENLPYLRKIGRLNRRVILSTGMANLFEIEKALKILVCAGTRKEKITILHANTEYPTPMEDVNLRAMQTIANTFGTDVGYSDHTLGIEVDIAAVAIGAKVIEKHFTLSRSMEGPDHGASLEPNELTAMVSAIRNIELALGGGVKGVTKSERKNMAIARKSIVAGTDIKKGEAFSENNLAVKRPGNGVSPMYWDDLMGLVSQKDYIADDLI